LRAWLALALVMLSTPVCAVELGADAVGDLKRAVAMVGASSSEEPALRQERQNHTPSPAFQLGTALGAWINAAAQLDFDLKNPAAAGPPHVSQGAANDDAIAEDCAEEAAAFDHLSARSMEQALAPGAVLAAAGVANAGVLAGWRARMVRPPRGCP
jgi:hypothetical protein